MFGRYLGEDAFLGSHEDGDCTHRRWSSCEEGLSFPVVPRRIACLDGTNRTLNRKLGLCFSRRLLPSPISHPGVNPILCITTTWALQPSGISYQSLSIARLTGKRMESPRLLICVDGINLRAL